MNFLAISNTYAVLKTNIRANIAPNIRKEDKSRIYSTMGH